MSTLSSTLRLANTLPCWNVRAMPSAAIASGDSLSMRRPANRALPPSARSSPLIRLKVVVFPAPFGPIRLTNSPSATSRSSAATATTPPKCRVKPRICSRGATLDRPHEALRAETDEQQQHDAVNENSILGGEAKSLRQCDESERAKNRAENVAHSAEDRHRHSEQGKLGVEGLIVQIGIEMGGDSAVDASAKSREGEGERLVALNLDSVRTRRDLVVA